MSGLSAPGVALAGAGTVPAAVLLAWNLASAAILLAALPVLQMSLPGPLQRFHAQPNGRVLFAFPLVLAPTLLAPLFFLAGLAHATGPMMRMVTG